MKRSYAPASAFYGQTMSNLGGQISFPGYDVPVSYLNLGTRVAQPFYARAGHAAEDPQVGPGAYTTQEALFAANDPSRLLDRTSEPVLKPELDWEKSGQYVAGTTFAEGLVSFHGHWLLYYGSVDSFVGVAQSIESVSLPGAVNQREAEAPRAIDPLLVLPVGELTQQQIGTIQARLRDWPQLGRYHDDDSKLPRAKDRVVFLGDSITDAWGRRDTTTFFPGKPYINRGISGQTTGQMLLRFHQDVVDLRPAAVLILAGINDIAGNAGESSLAMTEANLAAMSEIAQANHIHVILASVLPASDFPWRPGLHPAEKVRELNRWIRSYAENHDCMYLDYYSALADAQGAMKPGLSKDNVHPTPAGYAIMAPLAEDAIRRSLH